MTRVAISRADGRLSIMHLVAADPTDEQVETEVAKLGFPVQSWRRLDAADELPGRDFRGAWTDAGQAVSVDMAKARDIHRDRLRGMRQPLLQALDVAYMRADEAGDGERKAELAATKQALRDVTADPAIEAAETPAELAAVIPSILLGAG